MTKEEVAGIVAYCEGKKISYKQRLDELGIPTWKFYDSKRKFAPQRDGDNAGEFDNNLVENAIRPLALGRKSFLFCVNHDAAVCVAIVYSLVDSCKVVGVDPRQWMEDVLLRISEKENNRAALREFLPDKWAKQTN